MNSHYDPQGNEQEGGQSQVGKKKPGPVPKFTKSEAEARRKEASKRRNEKVRQLRITHPELIRAQDRKYRGTPEQHAAKQREFRKNNIESYRATARAYMQKMRDTDLQYRMRRSAASRIGTQMRRYKLKKHDRTMALIGCTFGVLMEHLEARFKEGMTWQNYGRKPSTRCWEIDHIIPCAKFDLTTPEGQCACFHFTNLQPLWADENQSKKDRLNFSRQTKHTQTQHN